jgi:UMF1 family MFS transporter
MLLYFPDSGDVYFALILFIVANVSFEMGTVFCNSYLPELSENHNSGFISGFAWGLGFVGGLIALFISLLIFPEMDIEAVKNINILVGIWLIIFSAPLFLFVNDRKSKKFRISYVIGSFYSIRTTFKDIAKYKLVTQFLVARIFYNDALVTIFALGGIYAVGTLNFSFNEVMQLGIVLNIAAALGSFLFGYIEDRIGVKSVINITLVILIFSSLIAIWAPETSFSKELFWFAGVLIGLMVGPNQSCSRSLMAKITPENKRNEFFGFFALAGKATSFIGPLLFGIVTSMYNQQKALWVVVILFTIGLLLFRRIPFNLLNSQDEI